MGAEPTAPVSTHPQIAIIPRDSAKATAYQSAIDKALSAAKKGPDGKPTIEILLNTDAGSQADRAKSLLKTGIAALVISPDNQQTLDTITSSAGRTPVIAFDTDLNTDKCKTTINPDKSEPPSDDQVVTAAIKAANDAIREKKLDKQITVKAETH
jgi:hypothetical protein